MLLWRQTTASVRFGKGREETAIKWLLLERICVKVLFQTANFKGYIHGPRIPWLIRLVASKGIGRRSSA